MNTEVEFLVRLVVAAILTGALGWERQTAGKSAGFRTHVAVGVASCLFVVAGFSVAQDLGGSNVRIEPFSLIQAIAVGIGFLGSGVVISGRDHRPHGLTTAASIWAAAAIGLTAGFGKFILSTGATILLLFVLRVGEIIERRYKASHSKDSISGG